MNILKKLSVLLLSGLLPIAFLGCNNDDDDDDGARGPAGAGDFVGVAIDINPTITFGAGNSFIYSNPDGTDLNFPSTEGLTDFTGTFTYTPSSNFTTGEMRLDFTSEDPDIDDIVLFFQSFITADGVITEFTVVVNGTSYPATVTTGTLTQAPAPQGGGSGSYTDTTIPESAEGSYTLYYNAPFGDPAEIPAGFEYGMGDTETFVINDDNTVTFAGRTLGSPRKYDNSTEIFIEDPSKNWWLAIETHYSTGEFVKVNLYRSPTGGSGNFIGQFQLEMPSSGGDGDGGDDGSTGGTSNLTGTFSGTIATRDWDMGTPPPSFDYDVGDTLTFTASNADQDGYAQTITLNGLDYELTGVSGPRVDYNHIITTGGITSGSSTLTLEVTTGLTGYEGLYVSYNNTTVSGQVPTTVAVSYNVTDIAKD